MSQQYRRPQAAAVVTPCCRNCCLFVVQVVRREGLSRGFGFVTFKDEISVEKCLLVNHFIKGRKVELKRAVPKVGWG
jgi:RNA recognition motif-containing protein